MLNYCNVTFLHVYYADLRETSAWTVCMSTSALAAA